jgi:hypothetical protein
MTFAAQVCLLLSEWITFLLAAVPALAVVRSSVHRIALWLSDVTGRLGHARHQHHRSQVSLDDGLQGARAWLAQGAGTGASTAASGVAVLPRLHCHAGPRRPRPRLRCSRRASRSTLPRQASRALRQSVGRSSASAGHFESPRPWGACHHREILFCAASMDARLRRSACGSAAGNYAAHSRSRAGQGTSGASARCPNVCSQRGPRMGSPGHNESLTNDCCSESRLRYFIHVPHSPLRRRRRTGWAQPAYASARRTPRNCPCLQGPPR